VLRLAGLQLRVVDQKRPTLGFFAERDAAGQLVVRNVDPDGNAAAADLRVGDIVSSWNANEPPRNPERWLYSQKPGAALRLGIHREDKEMTLELRLGEMTETFYEVVEDARAGERAKRIREGIVRGVTEPVTATVR
jgi:S1-C subfamily serine protease